MTIEEIDVELEKVNAELWRLNERRHALEEQSRSLRAKIIIEALKITRDDVQLSRGNDVPWFSLLQKFVEWLREQPQRKRFAEWNGTLFSVPDLIQDRYIEIGVRLSDLSAAGPG